MRVGSVTAAGQRNLVFATVLIAVIVVCSLITLNLPDDSRAWLVGLQVISAVAGAALGNFLRLDFAQSTVQNQARPAIRRLFDQAGRLGGLVGRAERNRRYVLTQAEDGVAMSHDQVADWFDELGRDLRHEINCTATAIDDWGDLAPVVRATEVEDYTNRDERMPPRLGEQPESES